MQTFMLTPQDSEQLSLIMRQVHRRALSSLGLSLACAALGTTCLLAGGDAAAPAAVRAGEVFGWLAGPWLGLSYHLATHRLRQDWDLRRKQIMRGAVQQKSWEHGRTSTSYQVLVNDVWVAVDSAAYHKMEVGDDVELHVTPVSKTVLKAEVTTRKVFPTLRRAA